MARWLDGDGTGFLRFSLVFPPAADRCRMTQADPSLPTPPSTRRVAWIAWLCGASFYCYGFFQRVAPSVMVGDLMRDFGRVRGRSGKPDGLLFLCLCRVADSGGGDGRPLWAAPHAGRGGGVVHGGEWAFRDCRYHRLRLCRASPDRRRRRRRLDRYPADCRLWLSGPAFRPAVGHDPADGHGGRRRGAGPLGLSDRQPWGGGPPCWVPRWWRCFSPC